MSYMWQGLHASIYLDRGRLGGRDMIKGKIINSEFEEVGTASVCKHCGTEFDSDTIEQCPLCYNIEFDRICFPIEKEPTMKQNEICKFEKGDSLPDFFVKFREALEYIHKNRDGDNGENLLAVGEFWTTYLRNKLKPGEKVEGFDAAMMMTLLKVARGSSYNSADSALDGCGYMQISEYLFQKNQAILAEERRKDNV